MAAPAGEVVPVPQPGARLSGWLLGLVAVVLVWTYTYRITVNPLKWEEPRRALVAMEMIHNGDYVVPRVLGEPYLKKPPMQNWLIALLSGFRFERVDALPVRLLSVLALLGTCALLWRLGLGQGRGSPHPLPAVCYATLGTVLQLARSGDVDALFCFFVTAAFACFELGRRRGSMTLQWVLSQLFVAAGILTKLIAPLFFYPPVLFLLWKHRRQVRPAPLAFLAGLLGLAFVVGAWLVPYTLLNPGSGMKQRWIMELVVRTLHYGVGGILLHVVTYPFQFLGWTAPWSLVAAYLAWCRVFHKQTFARAWSRMAPALRENSYVVLSIAVVTWGFVVFLFLPEQKGRYLMPTFPFVSVLASLLLDRGLSGFRGPRSSPGPFQRLGRSVIFWGLLTLGWVALVVIVGGGQLQRPALAWLPAVAGVVVLAAFAWVTLVRKRPVAGQALLVTALLYGVAYAGISELREADRNSAFVEAARQIAEVIPEQAAVAVEKGIALHVLQPVTHSIGRPLGRDGGRERSAYWVSHAGAVEPQLEGPLAETTPVPPHGRVYAVYWAEAPEAWSILGRPLFVPSLEPDVQARRESELAEARAEYDARPGDAERTIWLGRRLAYLGLYHDAIAIYSRGIRSHPDDPRFYRHRGHRYITLRRLGLAIDDLERAARMIEGRPDEVEPDGLPNARNIPTSTLGTNVWYHLGLAYYLRGDLGHAERCYRRCLELSGNPDMLCATSNWLYMTLRRSGKHGEAARVLESIHAGMQIIENHSYHQLLLMYKGELSPEELLDQAATDGDAALGYGVGNWRLYNGDRDAAVGIFHQVHNRDPWPAFGHIAAEADLARAIDRGL